MSCLCFSVQNKLWHSKLGHPNFKTMPLMFNSSVLNISFDCDICKMGKSKTLPFSPSTSFSTECFELIHSDVWGTAHLMLIINILWPLLMIIVGLHGSIFCILKLMCSMFLKYFSHMLKINFPNALKSWDQTQGENIREQSFKNTYNKKGFFLKKPAHTHSNRMAMLKRRIYIFLM